MKKLTRSQKSWINHETDEMILFAHETGGPEAVKYVAERIAKILNSNDFKGCEKRYFRNLN